MTRPKSVWDWVRVLRADPSRADEFDGWDRLRGFNIARILSVQPQLARYCDLSKLKPLAWIRLLRKQPQFVAQCDKWEGVQKHAPELFDRLLMEENAPSSMLDYAPLGEIFLGNGAKLGDERREARAEKRCPHLFVRECSGRIRVDAIVSIASNKDVFHH